jgi:hypothetical protein
MNNYKFKAFAFCLKCHANDLAIFGLIRCWHTRLVQDYDLYGTEFDVFNICSLDKGIERVFRE